MKQNHYDKYNAYWSETTGGWVEYEIANPPIEVTFPFWLFRAAYDVFIRPVAKLFDGK